MEGIHFKIDWYSAVFKGYSLRQVAKLFRMDDAFPAFLESGFPTSIGAFSYFAYCYNQAKFFVQASDLACVSEDIKRSDSIFDVIFPKIKFDLSGQALDWLRQTYFEGAEGSDGKLLDDFLRTHFERSDPTRVDFTYDFIDYRPSLFSEMIEFVKFQESMGVYRLNCKGLPSGLTYSYRLGDQSTLYLGSTNCTKLLRVYDKKRQFSDPVTHGWKVPENQLPFGYCNSWIRFEYQCRREAAGQLLFQPYDDVLHMSKSILMLIFDRYAFRDACTSRFTKKGGVLKFWLDLVPDWATYDSIIQIPHFVQLEDYKTRSRRYLKEQAFKPIACNIATEGTINFLHFLAETLRSIQLGCDDQDESVSFLSHSRLSGFLSTLTSMGIHSDDLSDAPGIVVKNDRYYFDFEFAYWYQSIFPFEEISLEGVS